MSPFFAFTFGGTTMKGERRSHSHPPLGGSIIFHTEFNYYYN